MKKLMLVTASALVLGMAGAGIGQAAEPSSTSSMPSTATPGSSAQTPSTQTPSTMPGSAAQTPSTMSGTQGQEANLSENQIMEVQQKLKTAGLYNGSVDGKMGSATKQAVQKFQEQHGLQATGTIDQETMAALQGNAGTAGSSGGSNAQPSAGGLNTPSQQQPGSMQPGAPTGSTR